MRNLSRTDQFSTTATTLTALEQIGFELGWDYAHHQLAPPAPYADEPSPLRSGLQAGKAAYGKRTLAPTRHVRQWLQLRLHAWLRGRSVEPFQVTPHYLQQLDVSHCPITRAALPATSLDTGEASIDRVRNDAGYAAGNLAMMSCKANHAKGANGFREAMRIARRIDADHLDGLDPIDRIDGLSGAEWLRVALLCSFVEARPHAEACALPLLLLPPNRLRLFNPVQALQVMLSRQFLRPGWSQRLRGFEELLPGASLQRDFKLFFMALLPRVLEAGQPGDTAATRWAVEDAWKSPLVQRRWGTFARQLTPAQCKSLLDKAATKKLATTAIETLSDSQATEGWNLASRGYVPQSARPGLAQSARPGLAHAATGADLPPAAPAGRARPTTHDEGVQGQLAL